MISGASLLNTRLAAAGSGGAGAAGWAEGRRSDANLRSAPTAGACPGGPPKTAALRSMSNDSSG